MPINDLIYVGTYSEPPFQDAGQKPRGRGKGIYGFKFDKSAGTLALNGVTEGIGDASYLTLDARRRFLYCVNEFGEYEGMSSGAVSAFRIDQQTGALAYLNSRPSHGADPCHLIVDKTGKFVLVANYTGGSVSVRRIEADGSLGEETAFVQHGGASTAPGRKAGPHAHAVALDPSGNFAFVADLGMDKVMIYQFDTESGELTPNGVPCFETAPGAGPRHLVMHPNGKFAYLINELNSTIVALAFDAGSGALAALQTVSTLPAGHHGTDFAAALQITPDGRFLYGSNRGHDSIVGFAIDGATGKLTLLGHHSTQGSKPRDFAIDPTGTYLLAANQATDNLVMFEIDRTSGKLTPNGLVAQAGTPTCVRFV